MIEKLLYLKNFYTIMILYYFSHDIVESKYFIFYFKTSNNKFITVKERKEIFITACLFLRLQVNII